jgi:hypothetical protein
MKGIYYFKMECKIYRGISLLSTAYRILYNVLLAMLTPYVNEIIGDNHFTNNGSCIGIQLKA